LSVIATADRRADQRGAHLCLSTGASLVSRRPWCAESEETTLAHLSGIQISNCARALALALLVGTAVLSLSTREGEARPYDTGVRCAIEQAGGYAAFSAPGYPYTMESISIPCSHSGD
jgi:hypothetical protein